MRRIKNKLIIFLFRLLDVPDITPNDKDEKNVNRWLADSWGDRGFVVYSQMRAKQLQKALANGSGMAEHPRDDYVRMSGQRFEHARFILQSKKAYQKREKERKK